MEGNKRVPKMKHPSTYVNVDKINELEKELKDAKESLKWYKDQEKSRNESGKTHEGIVTGITNYARMLNDFCSRTKITKPENIYSILKHIVNSFTIYAGHNAGNGIARNKGIEAVVEQLNKLKHDLVFQDWYEITYTKKERPKIEKKY